MCQRQVTCVQFTIQGFLRNPLRQIRMCMYVFEREARNSGILLLSLKNQKQPRKNKTKNKTLVFAFFNATMYLVQEGNARN